MRRTLLTVCGLASMALIGGVASASATPAQDAAVRTVQFYGEGYGYDPRAAEWREREWRRHEWERHRRWEIEHRWQEEHRGW